jgi:hypothetical protein
MAQSACKRGSSAASPRAARAAGLPIEMVAPVSIRASMTTPLILIGTCTSPSARRRPAKVPNPAGAEPEGGKNSNATVDAVRTAAA